MHIHNRVPQRYGWGSDEVALSSLLSGSSTRDQPSLQLLKSVGEDRQRRRRDTAEIIGFVCTYTRRISHAAFSDEEPPRSAEQRAPRRYPASGPPAYGPTAWDSSWYTSGEVFLRHSQQLGLLMHTQW